MLPRSLHLEGAAQASHQSSSIIHASQVASPRHMLIESICTTCVIVQHGTHICILVDMINASVHATLDTKVCDKSSDDANIKIRQQRQSTTYRCTAPYMLPSTPFSSSLSTARACVLCVRYTVIIFPRKRCGTIFDQRFTSAHVLSCRPRNKSAAVQWNTRIDSPQLLRVS